MENLNRALQNVFVDGKHSDLTVTCRDRTWKVHKLVVCSQSDFFSKACDGSFAEAKFSKVELDEEDPDLVEVMLHYFYQFDYGDVKESVIEEEKGTETEPGAEKEPETSKDADTEEWVDIVKETAIEKEEAIQKEQGLAPLLLNARMVALADKYFAPSLQRAATEKFVLRAYSDWNTDAFVDTLGELWKHEFVSGHFADLRSTVLDVVKDHAKELFTDDTHARFQQVSSCAPGFLLQYVKRVTDAASATASSHTAISSRTWYQCTGRNCSKHGAVFGFRGSIPANWRLNCPLRCTVDREFAYWSGNKVAL